jgi:hypothetical protein
MHQLNPADFIHSSKINERGRATALLDKVLTASGDLYIRIPRLDQLVIILPSTNAALS